MGLALQVAVEETYGAQFNLETGFVVSFLRDKVIDRQLADLMFKLIFIAVFKFSAVKDDLFALVSRDRQQLQVSSLRASTSRPGGDFIGIRIAP